MEPPKPNGDKGAGLDVRRETQNLFDFSFVPAVQGRQDGTEAQCTRCQEEILNGRKMEP